MIITPRKHGLVTHNPLRNAPRPPIQPPQVKRRSEGVPPHHPPNHLRPLICNGPALAQATQANSGAAKTYSENTPKQ